MTVRELISALERLPGDARVFLDQRGYPEIMHVVHHVEIFEGANDTVALRVTARQIPKRREITKRKRKVNDEGIDVRPEAEP